MVGMVELRVASVVTPRFKGTANVVMPHKWHGACTHARMCVRTHTEIRRCLVSGRVNYVQQTAFGMYVWYVYLVCIFGMYIWYVYLVCIFGMYIWYVYLICIFGDCIWYVYLVCIFGMYVW